MQKKANKEKYEKPELKSIQLHAEEVLALGCKSSTSGTAAGSSPCSIGTCSAVGS
jgi:hypothetical protein